MVYFQHLTKPKPLPAGCVGVIWCEMVDGRLYRGIVTNSRFDGEPARFIPAGFLPEFGRLTVRDHLKQIHRIGQGAAAFMQFENDEQRDARLAARPPHALEWFKAEGRRLCKESNR